MYVFEFHNSNIFLFICPIENQINNYKPVASKLLNRFCAIKYKSKSTQSLHMFVTKRKSINEIRRFIQIIIKLRYWMWEGLGQFMELLYKNKQFERCDKAIWQHVFWQNFLWRRWGSSLDHSLVPPSAWIEIIAHNSGK